MSKIALVVAAIVVLIACAASFFVGNLYGQMKANSGGERVVVLDADMVLLNSNQQPLGVIPAGIKLYGINDPHGDKTSLFKLFLQTDANDEGPITPLESKSVQYFEANIYPLKSKEWLKSISSSSGSEIIE
jgi:hypothetical protein